MYSTTYQIVVSKYRYMLLYHYDVMHKLTANDQIVVSELAILNIDMTLIKCIIYYSVVYLTQQSNITCLAL